MLLIQNGQITSKQGKALVYFIQAERERQGIERKRLAARAGLTRSTIDNAEAARFPTKFDVLLSLLDALGYDLEVKPKAGPP